MRIPFARMEPYLRNLIYDMNVAILPSGSSNGTFFINVVNPLQGQTASPTIDVAVWIRGCENMDFRVPRDVVTNRFLTTPATTAFNATVCL